VKPPWRVSRPFLWALLASLTLHLWLVTSPGWRQPVDELPDLPALEARLAPPPAPRAASTPPPVASRPRSVPRPAARPHSAPAPVVPSPPAEPADAPPVDAPPADLPEAPTDAAGPLAGDEPPAADIALPGRGTLRYAMSWGEQDFEIGRALHRWVHDGRSYEIQILLETTGLAALRKSLRLMQISRGTVVAKGLKPNEFIGERRKSGVSSERASFDWAENRVILVSGKRRREEALVPGAQDFASAWYQLGLEAPGRDRVELMVATGKTYNKKVFERGPQEMLETRVGPLAVVPWRTPPEPGEDRWEVWLAQQYHQLPARIRYTDRKGEVLDLLLAELEVGDTHLTERPRRDDNNPFLHPSD